MIELGNKYKKIAKGDIELASKYFLGEKTIFEKWIYVRPFQTQIENFGIQTDLLKNELNNGKSAEAGMSGVNRRNVGMGAE